MILGMLPTALNKGDGSEFRAPMAIAVIGGVISSTLLSLVVVPVFYIAIENSKERLRRLRERIASFLGRKAAALPLRPGPQRGDRGGSTEVPGSDPGGPGSNPSPSQGPTQDVLRSTPGGPASNPRRSCIQPREVLRPTPGRRG
jgi:hypothetical protein